jgi:ubiquinone/menaquinone biosynthesis C-methylase UbiE
LLEGLSEFLEELIVMSTKFPDHFSKVAGAYADFRPRYPESLFDYLASIVPPDSIVWDCAAGNGQASVDLAEKFARVIATDASAQQIREAVRHPRIEYRVALAEESALPDASVGLVTVAQALHWFDLSKFYPEVKRVLKPRGAIAVWCYGINHVEGEEVDRLAQEYYGKTLDAYWPESRRKVEAGYRILPFPFHEMKTPSFPMEIQWTLDQLLGYYRTWSATSRYIAANGNDPTVPLGEALARVWGDPSKPRRVTWPITMRLGRVES